MEDLTHTPDAPFRSGITGKYKLLIKDVTPKFGSYEYDLEDADGKDYKAVAKEHYTEGELLRCMVNFEVVNALLVVSEVAVCKKQDLATLIPEPPKPEPQPQPKPETKIASKPTTKSKAKSTKAKKSSASKPNDAPKKMVLGDPLHRRTSGTYVFRVTEVTQNETIYSYRVEGARQQQFEVQSKQSFPVGAYVDCGVKVALRGGTLKVSVSSIKIHNSVVVKTGPEHKRGGGLKHWLADTKYRDTLSGPNPGDHFHLIYTPMGNKR